MQQADCRTANVVAGYLTPINVNNSTPSLMKLMGSVVMGSIQDNQWITYSFIFNRQNSQCDFLRSLNEFCYWSVKCTDEGIN